MFYGFAAPKRKRPRIVKYEEENINTISTTVKAEDEGPSKTEIAAARESKPSLDLSSTAAEQPEKKENGLSKEEKLSPEMESSSGIRSDGGDVTITLRVKT